MANTSLLNEGASGKNNIKSNANPFENTNDNLLKNNNAPASSSSASVPRAAGGLNDQKNMNVNSSVSSSSNNEKSSPAEKPQNIKTFNFGKKNQGAELIRFDQNDEKCRVEFLVKLLNKKPKLKTAAEEQSREQGEYVWDFGGKLKLIFSSSDVDAAVAEIEKNRENRKSDSSVNSKKNTSNLLDNSSAADAGGAGASAAADLDKK